MDVEIKVAGTTFHPIPKEKHVYVTQEFMENNVPCAKGPAILKPEPENEHDPNAVAVYVKLDDGTAFHLGYVPKASPVKMLIKTPKVAEITWKDWRQVGDLNLSASITKIEGM